MDCIICTRELKGYQKKFCSNTCEVFNKTELAKKRKLKNKIPILPRNCLVCKISFAPIRAAHFCCSLKCRKTLNIEKERGVRHARAPRRIIKPMDCFRSEIPDNLETHREPVFNQNCSDNKIQILEFLKKGGEITRLPTTPPGKTPEVNSAYGWIPDELFGSALMYEMGDEE